MSAIYPDRITSQPVHSVVVDMEHDYDPDTGASIMVPRYGSCGPIGMDIPTKLAWASQLESQELNPIDKT